MKKSNKKFCGHCGKELGRFLEGAEKNISYSYMCDTSFQFAAAYSTKTGQRQYCVKYICPDWRQLKWFRISPHDNYFIDEIVFS